MVFFCTPAVVFTATTIDVPYTPQAPGGVWKEPWQNACEETVILMADAHYQDYTFADVSPARGILNVFYIKETYYEKSLDENAERIVALINNFFPWEAYIVEQPTLAQIRAEIDAGHPVIVPAYGKGLKNPYFQAGGPYYHTLIISGYDNETQEFITQEPGTSYGLNFRYPYARIMDAIHDFVPDKKTATGPKRVIFTKDSIDVSANYDADNDGATKLVEVSNGTHLHDADSDDDGFSDGVEIQTGYSPKINEMALLKRGALVKSKADPRVFFIKNNEKRHILNEQAFVRHGYKWKDLVIVSEHFLDAITTGKTIQ